MKRILQFRTVPEPVPTGADWRDAGDAVERHEPSFEQLIENCSAAESRLWHLVSQVHEALDGASASQDRICEWMRDQGLRLDITPNPIEIDDVVKRLNELRAE